MNILSECASVTHFQIYLGDIDSSEDGCCGTKKNTVNDLLHQGKEAPKANRMVVVPHKKFLILGILLIRML